MVRARSFEVGGLNIRVHTKHNPTEYVDLWMTLHEENSYSLYGSTAMMIGEVKPTNDKDPIAPISGYFYKFLNINPDEPWFDIQRKKRALDEDVSLVNIPNHLKPNLKMIPYVFIPKTHSLFFISKASDDFMAPSMVHRMLRKLTDKEKIVERFGEVDLTVMTDKKAVSDMLKWQVIDCLEIFIERPNALEDEDEEDVLGRLEELNAGSEKTILKKAHEARTLILNQEVIKNAKIAADHGEVKVQGINNKGQKDKASSKDFPMSEKGRYFPNEKSNLEALISLVINKFI